ncbi:rhamnulokinase [Anaerocolumna sp. AGMB13025]|uniref:rhamnulokinase n=1 Tax=Anaerocolumna sp. AGMB13025 TaxID=3039116 RepID=UPI00241DEC6F|nr:rhamnulokinase [Anaerocolumna sp. AGMB13025]WFR55183.1 rhamnulokinase [Anaerocolumna sp. AGMB13025]
MQKYYLAVDIGASSGRHILGCLEDGKITLEEIYRFENGMVKKDGYLCWELDRLFGEIVNGLKKCREIGKIPTSMGIDTWAVDFVLLDSKNQILGNTVGYRDKRTNGMDKKVYEVINEDELYSRTGIQKQIFNTIYQLMAVKTEHPEDLKLAESFLMIPDYFNYLLTGNKRNEYTNATTTQLVSPVTKDWDMDLIETLGYNKTMFHTISMPGTLIGNFTEQMKEAVGFDCEVILPATHDTGSAVLAVPANDEDYLYISSGTWSLMGIERKEADSSMVSKAANFTNEGGYDYRFRYLKNIMGLWMIQSVRHELKDAYSFARLCELAKETDGFNSKLDVNDDVFLSPDNMVEAIKTYCKETNQKVPSTVGELAACIYNSLAMSYAETVEEIEKITGKPYSRIHIVGGGANADYLNELTAKYTNKAVYAGPTEATAIGNILAQMLKAKEFVSLEDARNGVFQSFSIKEFK